jgi:hypothetical protein
MASTEIVGRSLNLGFPSDADEALRVLRNPGHFAAVVMAAGWAHMVGAFDLAAVGTFDESLSPQGVVGAPFVSAGLGYFFLWYCHGSDVSFVGCIGCV